MAGAARASPCALPCIPLQPRRTSDFKDSVDQESASLNLKPPFRLNLSKPRLRFERHERIQGD